MHYDGWTAEAALRIRATRGPAALWYHDLAGPDDRAALVAEGWDAVVADSARDAAALRAAGADGVEIVPPLLAEAPLAAAGAPGAVVCAGPVAAGRGLDAAVKAVGLLRRRRADASLTLAGRIAPGQERWAAGLQTLAERAGVPLRITDRDPEEPPPAGVTIDFAPDGPFPVGLAATMLRGVPAVVVAGGPAADALGAGALVLPDGDPRLLAEAIAEIGADGGLRSELRSAARAAAEPLTGAAAEERAVAALAPVVSPG
jgi:glycosyltransferase involved in cell wall biosynthesis